MGIEGHQVTRIEKMQRLADSHFPPFMTLTGRMIKTWDEGMGKNSSVR